jgi:hypothetical protein
MRDLGAFNARAYRFAIALDRGAVGARAYRSI